MATMSAAHPPLNVVAAALRTTTERLARELASPTNEPPLWTRIRMAHCPGRDRHAWGVVASRRSIALAGPARAGGDFCASKAQQSVGRHLQIESLLADIDAHARREGVALVALKGAALHAAGLYAGGERPMGDIDLLVRERRHASGGPGDRALRLCGRIHHASSSGVSAARKEDPGRRADWASSTDDPIKIELHTRIAEHLPVTATDITRLPVSGRRPSRAQRLSRTCVPDDASAAARGG